MIQRGPFLAAATASALLLAGCGGGSGGDAPPAGVTPPPPAQTRIDLLATSPRGVESIAYQDGVAWLTLSNTRTDPSAVLKSALPLRANGSWSEVPLGSCGLPGAGDTLPLRAPQLRSLGSTLWLFQPWYDSGPAAAKEHALCALEGNSFGVRDQGLKACYGESCSTLWMSELKQTGSVLYTNAGAGNNLFASSDRGATWRVLLGQFDSMVCTHQTFQVVGDRVLVGGECPLDDAFLRAYQLRADGLGLASQQPLPLTLPQLENRNVQFIEAVPNTQRVFVGVEGGLLRSEDGGRSFAFVIQEPVEGNKNYPYIGHFLALSKSPATTVVGGFDKATRKPYLAWSADGGGKWTDISSLLPGYVRGANDTSAGQVTSISEDPTGRVIVTVNEEENAKGRILLLTLAKP